MIQQLSYSIHNLYSSIALCFFHLNIIIKIMSVNKKDEGEECFFDQDTEETHIVSTEDIKEDITRNFHQQLPANQLRTARRPQNMAPRTFFLERPLYRLKEVVNRPCQQQMITVPQMDHTKLKLKIANSHNLPLQLYFLKNKFKCVYNKLETYRNDSKSFQGRLKGVDSLIDYNWKCFKELEDQQKTVKTLSSDKIDSDFESGNMCRAYTTTQEQNQYYLLIENDLNTYGYNNWFFFRFRNIAKGVRRFVIVNMIKKTSFFSQGMMISIFSVKKDRYYNRSWFKGGTKITFGTTNFIRNNHANDYYSSLSFQYDFQYENDEVYFALNQPYTYSRLVTFIENAQIQVKSIEMQVKTIGYSISNNIIPAIRFSKKEDAKEIILILARQHPCETVGSFVAQKIMQNLIELDEISQFLLNQFEFMIVPMVNPDGVIHGVSRCNMAGLDLNRQWGDNIIKELAPQTIKIKQFITNLTKTKKIRYMIDLHGHGKKLNTFFFSCKNTEKENIRLLSMSMKKVEPRFDIYGCTYGITRDKQNTIRSKINSMGIVHSYTLETSLFGWKNEQGQIRHFNQEDYESIAKSVIKTEPKLSLQKIGISRDDIISQMCKFNDKINCEDDQNYENNEILSESDPEGDKLDVKILLGNCENKALKKKIQDQYDKIKRPKTKRSKKMNRTETNDRFSSKNMRESCPSELYAKPKTTISNSFYKPLMNNKKPSINQKWEMKRREIKKKQESQNQAEEQRKNYTRMEFRSRMKTEAEPIRIKKNHLPYSSFMAKNTSYHQKIKTEFKEVQELNQDIHQEVTQMNRRSALQLKFKQLQKQQESLKVILTDTLYVSKINPNDNSRLLSPESRQTKNCSLRVKKEQFLAQPMKSEPLSKMATVEESQGFQKDSLRYKKFRQFLSSGMSSKKMEKITNSVFYYFPVL